jgi:xylulokinase
MSAPEATGTTGRSAAGESAVLGIDLGTQSTKAVLVQRDGRTLGTHAVPVVFQRPRPGWAEQSPSVLIDSAVACVAALAARFPDVEIAAIGVAAQMGGAIGIDADFVPVTPHEMWLDTRADGDRQELLTVFGPEILAKNGIIPFVAPRVRRWLRLDPALGDRLAKVVAPAGYLTGRLAGMARAAEAICDRTQANLFGCFDVPKNAWDEDLAERCGLPPALLPRVADAFDIVGALSAEMSRRTGLAQGIPVAAGIGDGTAGWFAGGGVRPGVCIATSGSSAHFAVTIDRFAPDPTGTLACMPSAAPGRFYLLGFTTSTGLTHRWLRQIFDATYEELERQARLVPPGANGVFAVPHFNGRVSPFEASIKGAFIGFDDKTGPGEFYRALLEASAFELESWLKTARRLAPGVALAGVVNVGGGAQNALWTQIKADVTGLTFRTAHEEVNAARGAALAAGIAAGAVDRNAHDWFAPDILGARTAVPDARTYAAYRPLADSYDGLVEELIPIFRKLKSLRQPTSEEPI